MSLVLNNRAQAFAVYINQQHHTATNGCVRAHICMFADRHHVLKSPKTSVIAGTCQKRHNFRNFMCVRTSALSAAGPLCVNSSDDGHKNASNGNKLL